MAGRGKYLTIPLTVLLFAVFCLCTALAVWEYVAVHIRGPANMHAVAVSASGGTASVPGYFAEITGVDETGTHTDRFLQKPDYVLAAFGGQLLGADRGEWGGELVFRDAGGTVHPMLKGNVRGIVKMPFGLIVLTGSNHLGSGAGAIFRVEKRRDGEVVATREHSLRGGPDDARWTTDGDLVFSVHYATRGGLFDRTHVQCLLLDRSGGLWRLPCLAING